MRLGFVLIFAIILYLGNSLRKPRSFPWALTQESTPDNHMTSYQELYFTQKVSHFNYKYSSKTWKQRYLIDINQWSKADKGPILMYMGNEGPIEMFYKNAGWYNDYVAKDLRGMLVYPECRYFGKSWPFGDQKSSMAPENLTFLTTEEALMDYV